MKAALPRDVSLNILFVIDICKLTLEEKGKLQEDLFGVGAYWSNSQRVIIEEGTDNSVGYYFIYPNRRITYLQKDYNNITVIDIPICKSKRNDYNTTSC